VFGENEDSLHGLLRQVIRQHFIRSHFLFRKVGLHKGQPLILALLWEKDGLTQKEIVEALGLRPSTVTIMLRRMEKAGLLQRKTDQQDMRFSRVYLTEKGQLLRERVELIEKQLNEECFSGFTSEEKMLLKGFLMKIRDNLKRLNDETENALR